MTRETITIRTDDKTVRSILGTWEFEPVLPPHQWLVVRSVESGKNVTWRFAVSRIVLMLTE